MAIDTRNKRSSAVHVSIPFRCLYPAGDGSIDQGDRQHVALMYSGILASIAQADPQVDAGVYVRTSDVSASYGRFGGGDSTYTRQGGTDSTYPRQ